MTKINQSNLNKNLISFNLCVFGQLIRFVFLFLICPFSILVLFYLPLVLKSVWKWSARTESSQLGLTWTGRRPRSRTSSQCPHRVWLSRGGGPPPPPSASPAEAQTSTRHQLMTGNDPRATVLTPESDVHLQSLFHRGYRWKSARKLPSGAEHLYSVCFLHVVPDKQFTVFSGL